METPKGDKAMVRVIKADRGRPKSGVVEVAEGDGKVHYKCQCDRCHGLTTRKSLPTQGNEVICPDCQWVVAKGKPTTRLIRVGNGKHYLTQCDQCGKGQKTPFLPKKDQKFLCDTCHRAEPQRSPRPINRNIQVLGTKEQPLFGVPCDRCRTVVKLKFVPSAHETFHCPRCYDKRQSQMERARNPDKPATRIMFNIECVICGRKETVDFIPSSLSETLCSQCFKDRRRR